VSGRFQNAHLLEKELKRLLVVRAKGLLFVTFDGHAHDLAVGDSRPCPVRLYSPLVTKNVDEWVLGPATCLRWQKDVPF
jgi:hypothetical protein